MSKRSRRKRKQAHRKATSTRPRERAEKKPSTPQAQESSENELPGATAALTPSAPAAATPEITIKPLEVRRIELDHLKLQAEETTVKVWAAETLSEGDTQHTAVRIPLVPRVACARSEELYHPVFEDFENLVIEAEEGTEEDVEEPKREIHRHETVLKKPAYLPDRLPSDDTIEAETTTSEASAAWGQSNADEPSYLKFNEDAAIREDVRSIPVLGRTIMSRHLTFRGKLWAGIAALLILSLFIASLYHVSIWIQTSIASGSQPVEQEGLGPYEPANFTEIEETLTHFFTADTLETQLLWVRDPERVRPLMEKYYENHPVKLVSGFRQLKIKSPTPTETAALHMVDVVLEPSQWQRRLVVEQEESGYKVDWEVAVGYQEQSWASFQETQPTTPKAFRAILLEGQYYNYQFSDRSQYLCWEIVHPQEPDLLLYGYTSMDSPLTDFLMRETTIKASGRRRGPSVIVNLAYPENPQDSSQVLITDLVQKGWVHLDNPPPSLNSLTQVSEQRSSAGQ